MKRLHALSLVCAAVLGSACSTLAPDTLLPAAPVPDAFAAATALPAVAPDAEPRSWREQFADPRLRALIELALAHNRDLRVAALNIDKARAQYGIQNAALYPALAASGGQTAQRLPADLSSSGEARINRQYSATLGFAAYELDFFGRMRSLDEQALQLYLGSEEARRSAQISLVAELANTWLTLAANRERLALARSTHESRARSFELTRRSFELGAVSALDLSQARTQLEATRAELARYGAIVDQDRNALAVLLGTPPPPELLPERVDEAFAALPGLPSGLPSGLLLRRPDIVHAERALRAANASIGAARAAFFPGITLTAAAGSASRELDGLFGAGSGTWSFVPQLRLPIFEFGRLQASLDLAEIQRDIQVAQYEKAIQGAFREVADALALRASVGEQLGARQALVEASRSSLQLSEARYRSGVDSHFVLLDAQRALYAAELELIGVRLAEAANRVALYKALGGGWQ